MHKRDRIPLEIYDLYVVISIVFSIVNRLNGLLADGHFYGDG